MRLLVLCISLIMFASGEDITNWNKEHLPQRRPIPLSQIVKICEQEWQPTQLERLLEVATKKRSICDFSKRIEHDKSPCDTIDS